MIGRPLILGENHHWWPKGLSKSWCLADRRIMSVRANGYRKPYAPKAIGRISDGHNLLRGGSWNDTFESLFDQPDNDFPKVVEWLHGLFRKPVYSISRVYAPVTPDSLMSMLSNCVASLIARNPTTRESVRQGALYFRRRVGMASEVVSDSLVAAGIKDLYLDYAKRIHRSGKFAFLYASEGKEFIFGDGFLHSFLPVRGGPLEAHCLIPLSPFITVLWFYPARALIKPLAVTIQLTDEETSFCNQTIQVYSKDFIYFRSVEPEIDEGFSAAEHRLYEFGGRLHAHPILDNLMEEVRSFR